MKLGPANDNAAVSFEHRLLILLAMSRGCPRSRPRSRSLALRGEHIVTRKHKGRPKGRDHINGIKGFWSCAKHWLYPLRGVPRQYFHLYLGEVAFF